MAFTVTILTFEVLQEIAKANNDLGLTVKETMKGAAAMGGGAATGAMVGGMLGGPVGMFVGGGLGYFFGSGIAANNMQTFKPLWEVLQGMNAVERHNLVQVGKRLLQEKGIHLATQIVGNYGGQVARHFLHLVYEECSGQKLQ